MARHAKGLGKGLGKAGDSGSASRPRATSPRSAPETSGWPTRSGNSPLSRAAHPVTMPARSSSLPVIKAGPVVSPEGTGGFSRQRSHARGKHHRYQGVHHNGTKVIAVSRRSECDPVAERSDRTQLARLLRQAHLGQLVPYGIQRKQGLVNVECNGHRPPRLSPHAPIRQLRAPYSP